MNFFSEKEKHYLKLFHDLNNSNKNIEYEIRFGSKSEINDSNFKNLLKSLKDNMNSPDAWKLSSVNCTLDIQIFKNNDINNLDNFPLRFSLLNESSISKFCKSNTLENLDYEVLYKNNNKFTGSEISELNGKGARDYRVGDKMTLDNKDYNIRFNVKNEVSLKKGRWVSENTLLRNEAVKYWKQYQAFLKSNNNKFDRLYKTFRLKTRYSFLLDNNRLDLTVVQSSKTDINLNGKYVNVPVREFMNAQILEQDKRYEVELELEVDKSRNNQFDLDNLEKDINFVLAKLNKYPIIISSKEEDIIKNIYSSYIKSNFTNIINKKLDILKDVNRYNEFVLKDEDSDKPNIKAIEDKYIENEYFKSIKNLHINTADEKSKLNDLLYKMENNRYPYNSDKNYFISPKVVSIDLKNIQPSNTKSIQNIPYSVTDKADGLGKLLYIVGTNHLDNKSISQEKIDLYDREYSGCIYLIDSNLKIFKTNIRTLQTQYYNTILNGEYLDKNLLNQDINVYKIYDLYTIGGVDKKHLPFISNDDEDITRVNLCKQLIRDIDVRFNDDSVPLDDSSNLEKMSISLKNIYIANSGLSIFDRSNDVWSKYIDKTSDYKYDGLIFTPANLPLSYSDDDRDFDLKINKTWFMNLKWKPPHENTIDFLIKEEKTTFAEYNNNSIVRANIKTKTDVNQSQNRVYFKYKTFNLQVAGYSEAKMNPCKFSKSRKNINSGRYLLENFKAKYPYCEDSHVAKIKIDSLKKEVIGNSWDFDIMEEIQTDDELIKVSGNWKENPLDIIKDDTIVEFAYKQYDSHDSRYEKDKFFRWVPLRTREDKTFKYKQGIKKQKRIYKIINKFIDKIELGKTINEDEENLFEDIKFYILSIPGLTDKNIRSVRIDEFKDIFMANIDMIKTFYPDYSYITKGLDLTYGQDKNVANNIWKTIHNPITDSMITTGLNIPDSMEDTGQYYKRDLSKKRDKSLTFCLQEFHNKIIKNDVLIKNISDKLYKDGLKTIHLLDMATGKGGDISKWVYNNISNVVGIDIIRNNIYDDIDGACIRLQNFIETNKDRIDFYRKPNINFLVGDVFENIKTGEAFKQIESNNMWVKLWKSGELNTDYSSNGFNVISMMFAIHYLFKSKTSFDNLIQNIDENLQNNGYFIGTCLDGKKLMEKFSEKNITKNKYLRGIKDGKVIWKIKNNNDSFVLENSDESLGKSIDVFISSINQEITEYVVNFDFLVDKLKEKNIVLVDKEESRELLGLPKNSENPNGLSTATFDLVYNDILNKMKGIKPPYNKKQKLYNNLLNKLSQGEKEISFMSRYFIFKKQSRTVIETEKLYSTIKLQLQKSSTLRSKLKKIVNVASINESDFERLIKDIIGYSYNTQTIVALKREITNGIRSKDINLTVKLTVKPKKKPEESTKPEKPKLKVKSKTISKKTADFEKIYGLLKQKFQKVNIAELDFTAKEKWQKIFSNFIAKFKEFETNSKYIEIVDLNKVINT
uniref:mRNA (guanine-N(7))-methyltransferase n=1 Tax=viral metagenome TaxID=1070528 RepID=A0A6C0IY68_9ZZZZ